MVRSENVSCDYCVVRSRPVVVELALTYAVGYRIWRELKDYGVLWRSIAEFKR